MADEQVIKLLEQIRDLQKELITRYTEALKNQAEAIALQKRTVRHGPIFMLFVIVGVIVAVLASFYHP